MLIVAASTVALLLGGSESAAEAPRFDVGKAVSTSFLLGQTRPRRPGYRVGVVNTELATGMLLPIQGSETPIEFISGAENWLWAQAAEQARTSRPSESLRLSTDTRSIETAACPAFTSAAQRFYAELESTLARPIRPYEPPPSKYRWLDGDGNELIMLDGTSFLIQVALADATIVVIPDGGSNPALQQAAYALHSVVSGCSNSVAPKVQTHDF